MNATILITMPWVFIRKDKRLKNRQRKENPETQTDYEQHFIT